ncbi:Alpha/Beta hydrolase protein [Hypoxylon cercidicola]|nr:Alpha/Beta hydrolase protein [Hypoxylon cercidicola]
MADPVLLVAHYVIRKDSSLARSYRGQTTAELTKWDDWEHDRVALQGISIHFRYADSDPPLLLIHGNPQFNLTWQFIGHILAQNYNIIAPDNRDAGDSSIPPDGKYSATAAAGLLPDPRLRRVPDEWRGEAVPERYSYHGSYSGPTAFGEDTVNCYAISTSRPGFLCAMLSSLVGRLGCGRRGLLQEQRRRNPLTMPVLAVGGEASLGLEMALEKFL